MLLIIEDFTAAPEQGNGVRVFVFFRHVSYFMFNPVPLEEGPLIMKLVEYHDLLSLLLHAMPDDRVHQKDLQFGELLDVFLEIDSFLVNFLLGSPISELDYLSLDEALERSHENLIVFFDALQVAETLLQVVFAISAQNLDAPVLRLHLLTITLLLNPVKLGLVEEDVESLLGDERILLHIIW